jgi:uncharacterized protein YigE (DUF2233 family)
VVKRGLSAIVVCSLAWVATANAAWTVVSSEAETSPVASVQHVRKTLTDPATGDDAELHLALFSAKNASLRIVDQPDGARAGLAEIAPRNHCVAVVNGGYFDTAFLPVGLLVSGGRTIAPLRKARLLSGVLAVTKGKVQLLRAGEFSAKSKPTEALQCGPFLIDRGQPVPGLEATRSARRTFIAVGSDGRSAIGYCSIATLAQLAQILSLPDFKITRALNLDGGSSSAFWFAGKGEPFTIPEQKPVRDFVVVVAR